MKTQKPKTSFSHSKLNVGQGTHTYCICGCIHTLTRRNYLCAETGIVALLFGALQGGGPGFWKAQLLAFQERSVLSPWQWRSHSLNSPPPLYFSFAFSLLFISHGAFKRQGRPALVAGPSTPLCWSFQCSRLTFNAEAGVERAKEHEMSLAAGVHSETWPLPISHLHLH